MSSEEQQKFLAKWNVLNTACNGDVRDDSKLAYSYCSGKLPECWTLEWVVDDLHDVKKRQKDYNYKLLVSMCIAHLNKYLQAENLDVNTRSSFAKKYGTSMARCFYLSKTDIEEALNEMNELFATTE